MSRQNKQRKVIATRIQTTKVHEKSRQATGMKRTFQTEEQRSSVPRTKKLTSKNKGIYTTIIHNGIKHYLNISLARNFKQEPGLEAA